MRQVDWWRRGIGELCTRVIARVRHTRNSKERCIPSDTGRNSTSLHPLPPFGVSTQMCSTPSSERIFVAYVHAFIPVSLCPVFRSKSYLMFENVRQNQSIGQMTRTYAKGILRLLQCHTPRSQHATCLPPCADNLLPSRRSGRVG